MIPLLRTSYGKRAVVALLAGFGLAAGLGYVVIRHGVNAAVERQALIVAEVVASQASTARSVYAREIAAKLAQDGTGPDVDFDHKPGHVPIPAQFLKMVGQASSERADRLYAYKPVSRWNLEASQGLSDDFLRWAWPQLQAQEPATLGGPVAWKAVSRIETQDGRRVLRYLTADPASQPACAECHNAYERRFDVIQRRQAEGVPLGKQWQQHQLLGALSVSIPLDRAQQLAGNQTDETAVFIVAILVASFAAMVFFTQRLARERNSLREAEVLLQASERERSATQAVVEAQQGVQQAFTELSTYMQAIDQHAIVSVADIDGRIVQVNDKLLQISGYTRDELIGQDHRVLSSRTHGRDFFAEMWQALKRGQIWRGVICNRSKSGQLYWVDSTIVPLKDPQGEVVRYISIRIDITERKQAEQDMLRLATHDSLTGLVNRALLRDRVQQALATDRRTGERAAVLFIDLDQFKAVNDSLGHAVGDRLLVEVARRLQGLVRGEDTVARQGGDEFIVFMPRLADAGGAAVMAEKLQQQLAQPFVVDGRELLIGSSIGIALFPDHGQDVDTLLKNSDTAMYQVKDAGRNQYLFFEPQMNQQAADRFTLANELRRAAERGELLLHYQPVMTMDAQRIDALEVLLRWQHPQHGLVPPCRFIPLAESSGQIVAIGEWVLRTACQQVRVWRQQGLQVPRLAINLSAIQVHHSALVDRVQAILAETGVEAQALEFEITEGSLMAKTDEVVATLQRLNALGLRLAIDDFGTGYSSLSYLKRLPIHTVKIDRSFVTDIGDDADDTAIVQAIVVLAHTLNLTVVAEGVETERQLHFLRDQGCDRFQGYLVSRPLPAGDLARLLPRLNPA